MFCYTLSDCVRPGTFIGVAKYTQSASERIHSHEFTEIAYLFKGKATHYVDGVPYPMHAGCMIYISPGKSHVISVEEEVVYMDIYNGFSATEDLTGMYTFSSGMQEQLETLLDYMYKEYINATPLYETILQDYYKVCLTMIQRKKQLSAGGTFLEIPPITDKQIRLAQNLQELACSIRLNPAKAKTLQEVAKEYHYSPTYLSRKFSALFGCSYTTYIYQQRFQHVCYEMLRSKTAMEELLKQSGISDISKFYKDFKNKFKVTPQQYRHKPIDSTEKK